MGGVDEAYADATTVYERGTTTKWAASDISSTEWSCTTSTALTQDATGLTITGGYTATKSITLTENSKVTISAVWNPGNATGNKNSTNGFLAIGDLKFKFEGSTTQGYIQVGSDAAVELGFNSSSYRNKDWTISATIDQATGSISYSITCNGTSKEGTLTHANGSYTALSFGVGGKQPKWTNSSVLKSISISEEQQTVSKANYTVKYVCDGVSVKDDATYEGVVGQNITLSSGDKATVIKDDIHYIYGSDDSEGKTIASDGSTVVTVTFHLPYTATLNVTYNVAGTESTETTDLTQDDDGSVAWAYHYPIYKKGADGKLYKADVTTSYGETGTFTNGETITKSVSYTTADNDVAYYAEAEDILSKSYGNATGVSFSGGVTAAVNNGADLAFTEQIAAGNYSINIVTSVRRSNDDQLKIQTSTDNSTWVDGETITLTSNKAGTYSSSITLAENSYVRLLEVKGQNMCHYVDYITLTKLDAPTVTINATSKLASYSNASAVTVPSDVVIYKAAAPADGSVVLTKVEGSVIPANTGVILYSATTGKKELTYGGTSTGDFTDNVLKATGNSTVEAGDNYYALVAGQQAIAKVKSGVEIPANKAYLEYTASTTTEEAKLNVVFDATVTGIEAVATNGTNDAGAIYNLSGQRVSKSYKGVVVKNGKKYINK